MGHSVLIPVCVEREREKKKRKRRKGKRLYILQKIVWQFSGNGYKLEKLRFMTDLSRYWFTNRVVNDWNRLGRHVISGGSIFSFKRRLDQSMDRDDRWPLAVSSILMFLCYSLTSLPLLSLPTPSWIPKLTLHLKWFLSQSC